MDNVVTVWVYIDDVWLDITSIGDKARVIGNITFNRGAGDESPSITPSTIDFDYVDSDGLFDFENPASPYYGKIGPGTPLRVQCDGVTQQVGEVLSILPSWDDGGRHNLDGSIAVIASWKCTDVVGRIQENDPPIESAMTRFYSECSVNPDFGLLHWWSFEGGKDETRVESNFGGKPMTGVVNGIGEDDAPPGALRSLKETYEGRPSPVPDGSTNLQVVDLVPNSTAGSNWTIEVSGKFPGAVVDPDDADSVLVEFRTHGTAGFWQIRADYVTKCWELSYFNHALQAFTITTDVVARDDEWHLFRAEIVHASPNYDVYVFIDGELVDSQLAIGVTSSPPRMMTISNFEDVDPSIWPSISHMTLWSGTSELGDERVPPAADSYAAFLGNAGEGVWDRFDRLLSENGIGFTGVSDGNVLALGSQDELPLSEILAISANSDGSWWFSSKDMTNTVHRLSLTDLYNQAPAFSATADQLSPPFRPTPNDQIANVITATNSSNDASGTGVVVQIPDGDILHWTSATPPEGVYPRPDSMSTNLDDPDEVQDVAHWRVHERAWKEKRYTALTYELARTAFSADDIAAVRALDLGSMIQQDITGSPPWVPYNPLLGIVRGWTRTLGKKTDTWTIATVPAGIWEVVTTDSGGSTLALGIDDNDTTALLATSDGPPWNPLTQKVQIDGDPVGVTAMATSTRTYIASGTMAHADNTTVNPALPAGITPDVGQSLFCFAACRTTTAEVSPTAPTGWTEVPLDPNITAITHVKLFHKYHVTGDAAPAITVTGGAAGNSVSAVTFAFSGVSPHTDNTNGVGGVWVSTNTTAQNITFPRVPVRSARTRGLRENGVMHLLLGWKQDDWTSVAPPGSYTEMFDGSTTTGNDQGLWGAYRDTSIPTAFASTSVAVTGGATAISKGFLVAIRPLQSATITRAIAGVATSHTAGDPVHAWHMGVTAL